jgi:hypothetical protein
MRRQVRVTSKKDARLSIWSVLFEAAETVRLREEHVQRLRLRGGTEADVQKLRANFDAAKAEVLRVILNTHTKGRR